MKIIHAKEEVIKWSQWKRCHHINECSCTKGYPFEEKCQTCGSKAQWTMKFNKLALYACTKCMAQRDDWRLKK